MENCTIYSHYLRYAEVVEMLDALIHKEEYTISIVGSRDSWSQVILEDTGYSEVEDLDVIIESRIYFDRNPGQN